MGVAGPGVAIALTALEFAVAGTLSFISTAGAVTRTVQVERERICITPKVAAFESRVTRAVRAGLVSVTRAALSAGIAAWVQARFALRKSLK